MPTILRIEGDPTSWEVDEAIDAGSLTAASGPVALAVSHPLMGRLLLSARSAGSIVILTQFEGGIRPNGIRLPAPALYVPTATGPEVHGNPPFIYTLPASVDLAGLEASITEAMISKSFHTVDRGPSGAVILNGATLPFVVLCPAT